MKAFIQTFKKSRSLRMIILIAIGYAIGFWLLSKWGVEPIWAALILLFIKGVMRLIYRILSIMITIAIVIYLIGLLIF